MTVSSPPPSNPSTLAPVGLAQSAFVGARGGDSVALVDSDARATGLRTSGLEFVVQYLGSVSRPIVDRIVTAGLAFVPVTYANHFDGAQTVAEVRALGLPAGVTVFLDVEADSALAPAVLTQKINAWADAVKAAGYQPGLYVGAGCPLTSAELYALHVVRYWKGASRIVDRAGALAEPSCGWCMVQLLPSVTWAQMFLDVDVVQHDYQGRTVTWTVKGGG